MANSALARLRFSASRKMRSAMPSTTFARRRHAGKRLPLRSKMATEFVLQQFDLFGDAGLRGMLSVSAAPTHSVPGAGFRRYNGSC